MAQLTVDSAPRQLRSEKVLRNGCFTNGAHLQKLRTGPIPPISLPPYAGQRARENIGDSAGFVTFRPSCRYRKRSYDGVFHIVTPASGAARGSISCRWAGTGSIRAPRAARGPGSPYHKVWQPPVDRFRLPRTPRAGGRERRGLPRGRRAPSPPNETARPLAGSRTSHSTPFNWVWRTKP
jgi:hypothetical protein